MVLIKNKKGIFFTMFVIVILSLFIITFTFFSNIKERKTTQDRITTLNNFVFSVEKDIPRKLYISAFRIIFLFEKKIIETGSYIPNLSNVFNETFFNGTILGETNPEIASIMQGAKFSDIMHDLNENAEKINAEVEILNPSITLSQEDPWHIKLTLSSNLIIKDKSNLAIWNKTSNISGYIIIENFEDPIYIINTNGLVINKIIKTPYTIFVQGSSIANLSSHALNSYYKESPTAPSFLDRLQGINSPNPNGIESLVNLEKLSQQGIQVKDKSVVDYIYLSASNPAACNVVPTGMPSWFKLDASHLADYQVNCA